MKDLEKEYFDLLSAHLLDVKDLDYSKLEYHVKYFEQLAQVSNSGVTIFDMFAKEHKFVSYNFEDLFGYDIALATHNGTKYLDERIHPDDYSALIIIGLQILDYIVKNKVDLSNYKVINEYRIKKTSGEYVRVIEQHRALEYDNNGNIWLSFSVIDISPDQGLFDGVKSKVLNTRNGEYFSVTSVIEQKLQTKLSSREVEILQLVKAGLLSKEISEKLFISVHTVNTHRQRILEKLSVDNSLEAVRYADKIGILS